MPEQNGALTVPNLRSDIFIRHVLSALEGAAFAYLEEFLREKEVAIRLQLAAEFQVERQKLDRESLWVREVQRRSEKRVRRAGRVADRYLETLVEVKERIEGLLCSSTCSSAVTSELEGIFELIEKRSESEAEE